MGVLLELLKYIIWLNKREINNILHLLLIISYCIQTFSNKPSL
jgi:hypothetical protein